ncbi:MAG: HepT-like ribonuclease domain-containing protein [Sediminibacterium sp.]
MVGEAVAHLTDETKNKRPDIEWGNIKGIRNIITHEYFGIDYKTVHKAVVDNIPPLKKAVEELLKDFE